jgi:hypothetical protein
VMSRPGFFKNLFSSVEPERVHRINEHLNDVSFKASGVTDNELRLLANSVKRIRTLDLEGTLVSNLGIFHLSSLASLTSLRLSNCDRINDGCIPFLNRLTSLQCLYINGTDMSLEGLNYLNRLNDLSVLGISASQVEVCPEAFQKLRRLSPNCKTVVKEIPKFGLWSMSV